MCLQRDQSNADRGGNNSSSSHVVARQKLANQRSSHQTKSKQSGYSTTSFYTAVPTASHDGIATSAEGVGERLPRANSTVSNPGRASVSSGVHNKVEGKKTSPTTQTRSDTPVSSKSLEFADHRMQSPSSINSNGLKKNIKDLMPRNVSNLSHGASSVATTHAGAASKIESKLGAKRRAREKRYYIKPIILIVIGVGFLILGIVFACLHFANWPNLLIAGPISLSVGLLLLVCGIVWTSIITAKRKRERQIMSRTFSV